MSVENLYKKALAKHQSGNFTGAIKQYLEILRVKPEHLDANYLVGTLYAETGNLPEALKYLEIAERIKPDSPYVLVNLANVLMTMEDYEAARARFLIAVELKPDLAPAYCGLGTICERADRNDEAALAYYQKAIALSPGAPEPQQLALNLLLKKGKPDPREA